MFAQWNVSWIFVEQHIASENRHGTVGSSIEMRFCSIQKLWSTTRGKKKSIKAKVSSWMTKNFFRCAHELTLKSPLYQNFPFAQSFTSVSSPWLVYCSRLLLRTLFAFYASLFFSSLLLSFGEAHKTIFYLPLRSVSSILSHRWDSLRLFRYWPDSLKQTPLDWHFFNYHSNNECILFVLISRVQEIRYYGFYLKSISNSRKRQKLFMGGCCSRNEHISASRLSNYPFIK